MKWNHGNDDGWEFWLIAIALVVLIIYIAYLTRGGQ